MLALNPNWWGDPSFMLSYAAVLSIAAFFRPLYERVRTRRKAVNALISIVIVGVVASLGTAPLVAWWFGNLPVAGMVINPAVILTAHVIVMLGVVWMVAPVTALGPAFSWALDAAAGAQNAVVEWSAARQWAAIPVGDVPLWAVVAAYVIYAALAWWLNTRK
jgi:competence protein ComEC